MSLLSWSVAHIKLLCCFVVSFYVGIFSSANANGRQRFLYNKVTWPNTWGSWCWHYHGTAYMKFISDSDLVVLSMQKYIYLFLIFFSCWNMLFYNVGINIKCFSELSMNINYFDEHKFYYIFWNIKRVCIYRLLHNQRRHYTYTVKPAQ